jgi:hypothetical protein
MKLGLGEVNKTYSYLENGYGVDLFKVQIKNPILHPIIVAFANNKAFIDYHFIEKDVWDAMINHFQTKIH